jgi:hypothetical protein
MTQWVKVLIRLRPETHKDVQRLARLEGIPVVAWIRRAVVKEVEATQEEAQ